VDNNKDNVRSWLVCAACTMARPMHWTCKCSHDNTNTNTCVHCGTVNVLVAPWQCQQMESNARTQEGKAESEHEKKTKHKLTRCGHYNDATSAICEKCDKPGLHVSGWPWPVIEQPKQRPGTIAYRFAYAFDTSDDSVDQQYRNLKEQQDKW